MIPDLVALDFTTDDGLGARARLGLIVLETDQTIEAEARRLTVSPSRTAALAAPSR